MQTLKNSVFVTQSCYVSNLRHSFSSKALPCFSVKDETMKLLQKWITYETVSRKQHLRKIASTSSA